VSGLDPKAVELGLINPEKYSAIERERRWLCRGLPPGLSDQGSRIEDLYIDGTRMRLRAMRTLGGSTAAYKLTKKVDLSPERRRITTIYLSEDEHALLATLPGARLAKVRRRAGAVSVDVFEGPLAGLVLAEAEFASDEAMAAFPHPDFAEREVTADDRYTGARLALGGLP
jgi:CYTH domain-containing protein